MTLFALLVLRFVRAFFFLLSTSYRLLNERYNSFLKLLRDGLVKHLANMPFGILHREVAQDDFFALDFVVEFVERMHDILQVAVALLFAHRLFAIVEERAFRNQHLRLENAAVVEQAFAKAIAHKAHERLVNFTRDFDPVLAEFDDFSRRLSQEFFLELLLVKVERTAHRRDGVLDFERFERKVLAVSQKLQFACGDRFNFRVAKFRFANAFEQSFCLDPSLCVFAHAFGHVINAVAFDTHHLAQTVVTHQATGMIAVRMRQEHVVQGNRRERAFTHVNAKIQLWNLDVRRKSRNGKSGNGRARRIDVDLPQSVVYVLIFVHFFTVR